MYSIIGYNHTCIYVHPFTCIAIVIVVVFIHTRMYMYVSTSLDTDGLYLNHSKVQLTGKQPDYVNSCNMHGVVMCGPFSIITTLK